MNIFLIQSIENYPGKINLVFESPLIIWLQTKPYIGTGQKFAYCSTCRTNHPGKTPINSKNTDFIHSSYTIYAFAMLYLSLTIHFKGRSHQQEENEPYLISVTIPF